MRSKVHFKKSMMACLVILVIMVTNLFPMQILATTDPDQSVILTYDPDDGITGYHDFYTVTVPVGGKVTDKPADPKRNGYFFLGWSKAFDDNNEPILWDFANDTVDENTTLWAAWEEGCIVTFDPDDGTTGYNDFYHATVHAGDKVTRPADPKRNGYFFLGWSKAFDGNGDPILWDFANDVVEENTTLWAAWEKGALVTFDPDDGVTGYIDFYHVTVPIGGNVTDRPIDPTKNGYQFKGWYHALDENDQPVLWDFANDTVEDNITLWASWVVSNEGGNGNNGGGGTGTTGEAGTTETEVTTETEGEVGTSTTKETTETESGTNTETEVEVSGKDKGPGNGPGNGTGNGSGNGTGNGRWPGGRPMTGDARSMLAWALVAIASFGILIVSNVRKNENKDSL